MALSQGRKPVAYQTSFASTLVRPFHLYLLLLFMYLPWTHVDDIFVPKGSKMVKIEHSVN